MWIDSYTRLTVSFTAIILTIFIIGSVKLASENLQIYNNIRENNQEETQSVEKEEINSIIEEKTNNIEEETERKLEKTEDLKEKMWQLEIPAINLIAPIAQGTSQEVMYEYIGHFEDTAFWKGNIGLAAHNRRLSNKLFWKN